jgi:tRNA(Ile)-lysidine synthase
VQEDGDVLDGIAADALERAGAAGGLAVGALEPLPAAVRRRVIRGWLQAGGAVRLTARQILGVDALVTEWHGQGGVAVGGDLPGQRLFAGRRDGVLTLYREPL